MRYCIPMGTDLYLHIMYPRDNTVDSQVTSYTRKRIAFLHKEGFYPFTDIESLETRKSTRKLSKRQQDHQKNTENWIRWKPPSIRKADKASSRYESFYWEANANKRRGNKHSNSKTTGQAWNLYELLHCAKIASQTGIDAVAHSLLSTDKSS